jgi:predicted nuclease of predicted toxin-antitoxin system
VKFLVDAQLPARLARSLTRRGHDATHTSELADGNRSADEVIATVADAEQRVVVTKDADFRSSHLVRRTPRRLLVVAVGNMSNNDLLAVFDRHLDHVVAAFSAADHVEVRETEIVAWDRVNSD